MMQMLCDLCSTPIERGRGAWHTVVEERNLTGYEPPVRQDLCSGCFDRKWTLDANPGSTVEIKIYRDNDDSAEQS